MPPPHRSSRPMLWIGLGVGVTVVVAVVALVVVLLVGSGGETPSEAMAPGDDSVHPEEIASIAAGPAQALAPMPTEPSAAWAVHPELTSWATSATTIVLAASENAPVATVIDAATGRDRFTVTMPAGLVLNGCAITGDRIGCMAAAVNNARPDVLMVIDADGGRVVATTTLPAGEHFQDIYGVGDRFIVKRQGADPSTDIGDMVGLDLSGRTMWRQPGAFALADQPIVVRPSDSSPTPERIDFLRATDGQTIVSATNTRHLAVPWTGFAGGIAVVNSEGTGTDIYRADGTKTASVLGWKPADEQGPTATSLPPVPILGRLAENPNDNSFTIGAANPSTGHILWRTTGSQFNAYRLSADMVGNLIGIRVGAEGAPDSPAHSDDDDFVNGPLQLLDPVSGTVRSTRLQIPRPTTVGAAFTTDGERVIAADESANALVAYDLDTGAQVWRLAGTYTDQYTAVGPRMYNLGRVDGTQLLAP